MRTHQPLSLAPMLLVALAASACGTNPSIDSASNDLTAPPSDGGSDALAGGDFGGSSTSGGGASEACGNGTDDNGDGQVDEGCGCKKGDVQPCFSGEPSKAGVGVCQMGTQSCEASGQGNEFTDGTWGACVGSGKPLTCEAAGATCGTADDGCGGTIACGDACPACTPGEKVFETAGNFTFTVPGYKTMTVKVYGAGGGGGAYGAKSPAKDGGKSSFDGKLVAEGGKGGIGGGGSALGGKAQGGMTNLPGGNGGGACDKGYPILCGNAVGGSAPEGGKGGDGINAVDGCQGGDGKGGAAPGGGGAGAWACLGPWWVGEGWGFGGGGAGAGSYATTTYTKGELAPGKSVAIVVGAAGIGAQGVRSDGQPGQGKNPGVYTGGDGGAGRVSVSWTCD